MPKQQDHARPVNLALTPLQEATLEAIGGHRGLRWAEDNSLLRGLPESLLAVLVFQDGRVQEVEVEKSGRSVKVATPFGKDFLINLDELVRWGYLERREELDAHPGWTPGYLVGDLDIQFALTETEFGRWDLAVFIDKGWAFMLRYEARSREQVAGRTYNLTERGKAFLKGTKGKAAKAKVTKRRRTPTRDEVPALTTKQIEALNVLAECRYNFAEAGRRLGRDPKSIRERVERAYTKLNLSLAAETRRVRQARKTQDLPHDRSGQVHLSEQEVEEKF